jgi:hypothetical protein
MPGSLMEMFRAETSRKRTMGVGDCHIFWTRRASQGGRAASHVPKP